MKLDASFSLKTQVKTIIDTSLPLISNLSNLSSVFKAYFKNVSWSGFYLSNEDGSLFLGPFQGDVACTKIALGKGVCGTAALEKKSQLVPNVHEIANHIACSSSTNSELVVPLIKNDKVVGVIDLDSDLLNNFTESNQKELEEVAPLIANLF